MFTGHSTVKFLTNQTASGGFPASTYFTADQNYMIFLIPKVINYSQIGRVLIERNIVLSIQFVDPNSSDYGFNGSGMGYIATGERLRFENITMTFDLYLFSLNN